MNRRERLFLVIVSTSAVILFLISYVTMVPE